MSMASPTWRKRAAKSGPARNPARRRPRGESADWAALERRYLTSERLEIAVDRLIEAFAAELPRRAAPALDAPRILRQPTRGSARGVRGRRSGSRFLDRIYVGQ